VQEDFYHLPYHWFPERRLQQYERQEKQRIIFELIGKYAPKVQRYLDVGCGDGRWTADIYNYLGYNVSASGIDFSERAITFAKLITPDIDFQAV